MNHIHQMLPEDEIILCGSVLVVGFIAGVVARLLVALRGKEDGMSILLAHHIEAQHVPILLIVAAAGFWIGWTLMGRRLNRRAPQSDEPSSTA